MPATSDAVSQKLSNKGAPLKQERMMTACNKLNTRSKPMSEMAVSTDFTSWRQPSHGLFTLDSKTA